MSHVEIQHAVIGIVTGPPGAILVLKQRNKERGVRNHWAFRSPGGRVKVPLDVSQLDEFMRSDQISSQDPTDMTRSVMVDDVDRYLMECEKHMKPNYLAGECSRELSEELSHAAVKAQLHSTSTGQHFDPDAFTSSSTTQWVYRVRDVRPGGKVIRTMYHWMELLPESRGLLDDIVTHGYGAWLGSDVVASAADSNRPLINTTPVSRGALYTYDIFRRWP